MRKIELAVDSARAIVICAPKHKFIEWIKRSSDGQHGANEAVTEMDPNRYCDKNILFCYGFFRARNIRTFKNSCSICWDLALLVDKHKNEIIYAS